MSYNTALAEFNRALERGENRAISLAVIARDHAPTDLIPVWDRVIRELPGIIAGMAASHA